MAESTKVTVAQLPQVDSHSCLVMIYGDDLGKRFELEQNAVSIGREDDNNIVIELDNVSRQHCRVWRHDQVFMIEDLGSTNGTFVNDEEVVGPQELRSGDLIKVGGTIFKYFRGGDIESLYHEEIYRLTIIDGLTTIFNKRYFGETLVREMARCHRYNRPLSLIIFDIDHFKIVNDEYGHLAGDFILRTLAQTIKTRIRTEEVFSRYGGEEFAILLPEMDKSNASYFAEKVRLLVKNTEFVFEDQRIPITISLGVAQLDFETQPEELLKKADEKLYAAKQAGRNRVES